MKIFLVGFMGSGKTTLGRLLAVRLGRAFVDLDGRIEAEEGMPIRSIFELRGEAAFRATESRLLASVAEAPGDEVVACGGGAYCSAPNRKLIAAHGISVWLDRPLEAILGHPGQESSGRPLWSGPEELRSLFAQRRTDYALAALRFPLGAYSEASPEAAADGLLELLRSQHAV